MITGSLIREARLRADLTQAELAARAGTSQSAVARWETGGSQPSLERLRSLMAACGFDLRVAIEGSDQGQRSLIESRLTLTPEQRLDDLTRTIQFLREGRRAMTDALKGTRKTGRRLPSRKRKTV